MKRPSEKISKLKATTGKLSKEDRTTLWQYIKALEEYIRKSESKTDIQCPVGRIDEEG